MTKAFNMPPLPASFEVRGGWLVNRLAAEFELTHIQAAGIVGNLGYESVGLAVLQEIKPAVPGSRGGAGWAMWTGPRRRAFEAWAAKENLSPSSDEANYGFLVVELTTTHRNTIEALRKIISGIVGEVVFSVGQTYERPGGTTPDHLSGFAGRMDYARRALKGAVSFLADPPRDVQVPTDHRVNPPERRTTSIAAAIRVLQGALGVTVDGDFGRLSQAALTAYRKRK